MKLKALAAVVAATPLMVACGSNQTAEVKEPFKLNKKIDPFETYISDPEEVPEEQLVTEVHFPIK